MTKIPTLAGFARLAFATGAFALTVPMSAPGTIGGALAAVCAGGVVRFVPFDSDEEPDAPSPSGGCHALACSRQAEKRLIRMAM